MAGRNRLHWRWGGCVPGRSARALWVGRACVGRSGGPAVFSRSRWPVPRAHGNSILGDGARDGAECWCARPPDTVSTPPWGVVRGPCPVDLAPGTQPMGSTGDYSGCGVVWCGVVWLGGGPGRGSVWVAICAVCSVSQWSPAGCVLLIVGSSWDTGSTPSHSMLVVSLVRQCRGGLP